ncbi:MAG: phosphoribosyl-AMP cyclohydrolase [Candidatus Dormibacteria bacterium]
MSERPRFDGEGLVPAIVQDASSGMVLMLAYMNAQAWERTLRTGQAWFWSRSRGELWEKGASSGHRMAVLEIRLDCDQDTVLLRVDPSGPACHTGERSCFFTVVEGDGDG